MKRRLRKEDELYESLHFMSQKRRDYRHSACPLAFELHWGPNTGPLGTGGLRWLAKPGVPQKIGIFIPILQNAQSPMVLWQN